nr:M56 family metallopeptidase [uncultured Dysosmobacter sp.]
MREILLTSSVLILALLALRTLFRERISRRVQYALWGLVALRLLVPFSLPGAGFSALSAAEPVSRTMTERLEQREIYKIPLDPAPVEPTPQVTPPPLQPDESGSPTGESALPPGSEAPVFPVIREWVITAADLLRLIWWGGMAVMALWLGITNLRFWQKLHKVRTPYSVDGCRLPVYLVEEGLPSPCLFGLLRPAIYLTPAAVETPERLRHVLSHETAHARHGDALWSLVRCLCLTIYWFDPLVWAAAAASKTDCELACDEAALRRLGPEERIPYGRTLLALIPVRRGPGSPLLSATTMTADKRRLRDRITRIAENRQTKSAALFLVLSLTAVVCAVTFTGAKQPESRPLTGDELAYFNETFFNNDGGSLNIRNQFLNSLYQRPEEIDLYELFYCGTGRPGGMSDEELGQVGSFGEDGSQICPTDKLPVSDMDAVLLENTGLTLAETAGIGLEHFQHLPEYDAYYHTHGDTNYFHSVQIAVGERTGDTLRLYYPDSFARYEDCDWLCVTLAVQSDGSYWFVSNQPSEKPAIPTVYPEGEPALTIPLTDLAPSPAFSAKRLDSLPDDISAAWDAYGTTCRLCRLEDGNLHVVLEHTPPSGGTGIYWDVFTFPEDISEDQITLSDAYGLLGHDCVVVSYRGYVDLPDSWLSDWINDYYSFDGDGTPVLLARAYGETAQTDLDGDGADELCASSANTAQIFFQRDGTVYEADCKSLLSAVWPQAQSLKFESWNISRRCLSMRALVPISGHADTLGCASRSVYFNGENLLVYRDTAAYTDHIADDIEAPEAVLSAARERVLEELSWWQSHTGQQSYEDGIWRESGTQAEWDDWRITALELTDTAPAYPELGIQVWSYGYELHPTTPADVILAGGMYMDEDGWVGGMNSDDLLVFHTLTDSGPTLLESSIPTDVGRSSDSPMFAACLARVLLENGLLTPSQVRPQDLYYMFYDNQTSFLNLMGTYASGEQDAALHNLAEYAVSIADTSDGALLSDGLQNLEWNSSALTTAGHGVHVRLLAILDGQPAPPSEAEIRAAILDHRASTTARSAAYATEAHHVLDLVRDGGACTVYLMVYYSAYDRTPTGWQLGTDGQFPGSVTFVYRDGGWAVQEYWEPLGGGRYAPDLYANFPPNAAEAVLTNDALWSALQDQCAEKAAAYFAAHPVSADPLETPAPSP